MTQKQRNLLYKKAFAYLIGKRCMPSTSDRSGYWALNESGLCELLEIAFAGSLCLSESGMNKLKDDLIEFKLFEPSQEEQECVHFWWKMEDREARKNALCFMIAMTED